MHISADEAEWLSPSLRESFDDPEHVLYCSAIEQKLESPAMFMAKPVPLTPMHTELAVDKEIDILSHIARGEQVRRAGGEKAGRG